MSTTVEELETKLRDLEAQMATALGTSFHHGQEHSDEGQDPMLGLNRLRSVATAALLPATADAPTIYYVAGPPLQLFLIDSTGQRELGYSEEQRLTGGDLVVTSAGFVDVPGCSITLPIAGSYVVIGNYQVKNNAGVENQSTGILVVDGVTQSGSVRQTLSATAGVFSQGTRVWRITTSAANEVARLRIAGLLTTLPAVSGNIGDTSIVASSFLGGGQTAASHQHSHSDLTTSPAGAHHTKYTDAEARTAVPTRIYQAF